jgi:hypothetical protein|tara:strand:- start:656 stop:2269 length:1614 start_codon:yes stop_codon:yes gene_type:complete
MAEFNIKDFSTEKLQSAFDKAILAKDLPNALLFNREIESRDVKTPKETGMTEQALGGFYEGLARGAGAPVDIMAAGVERLGIPVGDNPMGGSESIKGLLQGMSFGQAIPREGPQTTAQRVVRGGTEVVGESIPATLGLIAAAPKAAIQAAPTALNAFKEVLSQVRVQAQKAPATFAASEAAVSGASGAAGGAVEEIFPDNPTAKMIAELLGSVGGVGAVRSAEKIFTKMPSGPLSAQQMKETAGRIYDDQIENGLSAQPDVTSDLYGNVFEKLDTQGIILPSGKVDPEYGKVSGLLKILDAYSDKGMTGAQILRTRQAINGRLNDAKGSEKNALRNILRDFDASTAEIAPQIKTANALYSRAMKADQLEEMMELARIRAGQFSQSGMENAIRTEFRQLSRRIIKGQESGWSQAEVEQIRQISEGGTLENAARFFGKFSPKGVVSAGITLGVPFSAAMQVTGDPLISGTVAGSVAGVGKAGELTGAALQAANVERLMKSVVQGRNLAKPAEDRLRAAVTAYLAGKATASAQPIAASQP